MISCHSNQELMAKMLVLCTITDCKGNVSEVIMNDLLLIL